MQVFLHTDSILEELGVTSGSNINSIYEAQEVGVDEIMRNHSLKELIEHYITTGKTKSSTNLLDTKTSQNTIQSKVYRWFQLMYYQ